MTIEAAILDAVRQLPPEERQKVLDFADSLKRNSGPGQPRRSLYGLWEDLSVSVSEDDIAEARREMWRSFPRNGL